jgi:DeoR/GlpR family transcriptional regulator of sugar metabolism
MQTCSKRSNRRGRILSLVAEHGPQAVETIAAACGVSAMTVRRDLAALQDQGVLVRTHGGCMVQSPFVRELSFSEKLARNLEAKSAIAEAVVGLLGEADNIYLDTGTTALLVARHLPTDRPLQVTTNNLRVALELFGRPQMQVVVLGGVLAAVNPDLVGAMATEALQHLRFDLALLGADAIDCGTGEVASADEPSAELSRQAWRRAQRALVLADHSKLGRSARFISGQLGGPHQLVTDTGATAAQLADLRRKGVEVTIATDTALPGKDPRP